MTNLLPFFLAEISVRYSLDYVDLKNLNFRVSRQKGVYKRTTWKWPIFAKLVIFRNMKWSKWQACYQWIRLKIYLGHLHEGGEWKIQNLELAAKGGIQGFGSKPLKYPSIIDIFSTRYWLEYERQNDQLATVCFGWNFCQI